MKCEICGNKDILKQDNLYVCQKCGCKYSFEEAKKLYSETENNTNITQTDNINTDNKTNSNSDTSQQSLTKKKGGCLPVFIILIITVVISAAYCSKNQNNTDSKSQPQIFTRNATLNDINLSFNTVDITLNISFFLKPKVDIDNLKIIFNVLDKNKNILATKTENIGNVKKDIQYTISFNLTEFSVFNPFIVDNFSATIAGGTVFFLS